MRPRLRDPGAPECESQFGLITNRMRNMSYGIRYCWRQQGNWPDVSNREISLYGEGYKANT